MQTRRIFPNRFFGCALMVTLSLGSPALAGRAVYVGSKSTENLSFDHVDHSKWTALLAKYVDQNGMVDYRSWQAATTDLGGLDQYLRQLSAATPKVGASKASTLAFWINAYNAVTIRGILREYPTTSIRNHTPKLFGYHIWHDLQLYVGGKPYSLEAIEHEVLRKMSEPRIHFAIVCASIGCPRLLNEAYEADRIEDQLTTNAEDFFSRRQNFRYDASANRFHLSSILSWFEEDFGSNAKQMLATIARWLPTSEAQQAAKSGSARITYLTYNWQLNKQ